jgi:hypothetical protein
MSALFGHGFELTSDGELAGAAATGDAGGGHGRWEEQVAGDNRKRRRWWRQCGQGR